jgi:hypothetical protein
MDLLGGWTMKSARTPFNWKQFILSALLTLATGCQSILVERNTVSMAERLSDIQYGQVMDNLALVADNPGALPHFVLTDSGKTVVQETDQTSFSMIWGLIVYNMPRFSNTLLSNASPAVQYIHQDADEWDGEPALQPVQELLMRDLYHKALGLPPSAGEAAVAASFFSNDPFKDGDEKALISKMLENNDNELVYSLANAKPAYFQALYETYNHIEPCHIHVGHRLDVPRDACYVGHHGHTYVWAMKDDMESLTNLTISVLAVAVADTAAQANRASKPPTNKIFQAPAAVFGAPSAVTH